MIHTTALSTASCGSSGKKDMEHCFAPGSCPSSFASRNDMARSRFLDIKNGSIKANGSTGLEASAVTGMFVSYSKSSCNGWDKWVQ